ncbi:MAG: glycosyltransferase family 4 protein [Candidatus Odinarchaeota archaeon]
MDSSFFIVNEIQNAMIFLAIWKIVDSIAAKINHIRITRMTRNVDVVHLIKVNSLELIKQIRAKSSARIVYDLGDAVWLPNYKGYQEIDQILQNVDAVTCDNRYGLDYAGKFNKSLFLYPGPSQVEMFDKLRAEKKRHPREKCLTIGWIGSPNTVFHLYSAWEALEKIFEKHQHIHLRLVGVGKDKKILPRFENVRYSTVPYYSSEQMVKEVLNMDIGLFPMFDVQEARVRGILKATIYMSGEAAVVASPRGQVTELITDGVNGFLADSTEEWVEKLDTLIKNHELRQQLIVAGLETVRKNYSLEKCFEKLRLALQV